MTGILLIYTSLPTAADQWRPADCISEYRLAPNMGRSRHIMNHAWDNITIWTKGMLCWYKKWINKSRNYCYTVNYSHYFEVFLTRSTEWKPVNDYLSDKIAYQHHHHQLLW